MSDTGRTILRLSIKNICILAIFINMQVFASEEKFHTGFVQEISESRIELDTKHVGMYLQIGFLCEPEVCQATADFLVGDEVLLTLGSVNHKNKLLSIRKCLTNDIQCSNVKELEIKEEAKRERQLKVSVEKHRQCRAKMDKDIVNKNSYFPDNEIESSRSDKVLEEYQSMNKKPEHKECLSSFVQSYRDAILEACLKYKCGQRIGGGCYHIAGYSITTSVLEAAIARCSI